MEQRCPHCQSVFELAFEAVFCPRCGRKMTGGGAQAAPISIEITGDSRRAVEERYWTQTVSACTEYVNLLREEYLPSPKNRNGFNMDYDGIRGLARKSKSTAELYAVLGKAVSKITGFNGNPADSDEQEALDVERISLGITGYCESLLRLIDPEGLPEERPVLNVHAVSEDTTPKTSEYEASDAEILAGLLNKAYRKFKMVVDDNGIYAAFAERDPVEETEQADEEDPKWLRKRYRELSRMADSEYDPLFGEGFEDLIYAFWGSLDLAILVLDDLYGLNRKSELREAQENAVGRLLHEWNALIRLELDKAYSSQKHGMIDLYKSVRKLSDETSEALRA